MIDPETLKAWTPIILAGIGVCGWFITNTFNNRNEVFKQRLAERLKRRMKMFEKVTDAIIPFANPVSGMPSCGREELHSLISEANILVQLYGSDDEIASYQAFLDAIEQRDMTLVNGRLVIVSSVFRNNFRVDLGYKKK